MSIVHASRSDLKKIGIKMRDLVTVEGLDQYGWDDEIVNGLMDYEILPDVFQVDGIYMVKKASVIAINNQFIKNELRIYKTVDDKNKLVAEAQEYLEEHKKLITPEQLELIKEGKLDIMEVLKLKPEAETVSHSFD